MKEEFLEQRREKANKCEANEFNVSLWLDDIALGFDFWENLATLAGKVVPGHQSKEYGEEDLVPADGRDVSERDIHQPVGGAREDTQKSQIEEKIVTMLSDLWGDALELISKVVVNYLSQEHFRDQVAGKTAHCVHLNSGWVN